MHSTQPPIFAITFVVSLVSFTVGVLTGSEQETKTSKTNITAHIQMCDSLGLAHSVYFKDDDTTKEVIYVDCEPN